MINQLLPAWRGQRVLLIGHSGRPCAFMQALLEALGAKCARIPPGMDAEPLCRAMQTGRISAVVIPELRALADGEDPCAPLAALHLILCECREAGVPLALLLSDAAVYRSEAHPAFAREDDPIGGQSRDGLLQSILQLYADGFSRGLLGDAVSVLCVRHLPLLGCGHPAVSPYSRWCAALDSRDILTVPHPGRQCAFLHPADMLCGALLLGARFLLGDTACAGVYNLGAELPSLAANRTAALRMIRDHGGTRPIWESFPPDASLPPMPDGTRARMLCGACSRLPFQEALSLLLQLERAARISPEAEAAEIRRQAEQYLSAYA